ncbi:MAG: hypothetical protein RLZZ59_5, partial [Pseudomonadota bacterium]
MLAGFLRICFLLSILTSAFLETIAAVEVKVDTTISEDSVFLIFRHPRSISLNPSFLATNGRVRSDTKIDMSISSDLVNSICTGLSLDDKDQKSINFKLSSKYKFLNVIYGEKLVAFKLNNPDFIKPENKDKKEIEELENSKDLQVKEIEVSKTKSQQDNKKALNTKVQYTQNAKFIQLSFPFEQKGVGAAVFKRGGDVWVVFDTRRDFHLEELGGALD